MVVNFKLGGASPFIGIPAGNMHNRNVPLDALWGSAALDLRDRILKARMPDARFRLLEQCLLGQAHAVRECHPAITFALREFEAVPQSQNIADITKRTGLSLKWFIELFRAAVGLTPKLYCRLQRFRAVVARIGQQLQPDWAELACACGYFDQAHLIRDFRNFSGLSPTSYLADRMELLERTRFAD
jgi:methylphosphotriester-DNA--protein-cysteine methyltransferase